MSFQQRAASLRASTISDTSTIASSSDIYNELILQKLESDSIFIDTPYLQPLTTGFEALVDFPCKYVTLINKTTNASVIFCIDDGDEIELEAGYSIKLNVSNAQLIKVKTNDIVVQDIQTIITA
jgi:hypothetical protein